MTRACVRNVAVTQPSISATTYCSPLFAVDLGRSNMSNSYRWREFITWWQKIGKDFDLDYMGEKYVLRKYIDEKIDELKNKKTIFIKED